MTTMEKDRRACARTTPTTAPKVAGPLMLLAHADYEYGAMVSRCLSRLGWEVRRTQSGVEARIMVRQLAPSVIVLGVNLPDETGWLTCAKLMEEHPDVKVILVDAHAAPDSWSFAEFAGAAALVCQDEGVQALVEEVLCAVLR